VHTTSMPSVKQNPLLKALSEDQIGHSSSQVASTQSSIGSNLVAPGGGQAVNNDRNFFPISSGSIILSNGILVPNLQPNSSFVRAGGDLLLPSASQVSSEFFNANSICPNVIDNFVVDNCKMLLSRINVNEQNMISVLRMLQLFTILS
jgi:hypothetical protein